MSVSNVEYDQFCKDLNSKLMDLRDNATINVFARWFGNSGYFITFNISNAPLWCDKDLQEFKSIVNNLAKKKSYKCSIMWNDHTMDGIIQLENIKKEKVEGKLIVFVNKNNKYIRAKQEDFKKIGVDPIKLWSELKGQLDKNKMGQKIINVQNKKLTIRFGYNLNEKLANS